METKDKLIGVVLIITGLILIGVGMLPTIMKANMRQPSTVNPYNEVNVYNQDIVPMNNNAPGQDEVEQDQVNVYFEEEVKEEGSNRYIY